MWVTIEFDGAFMKPGSAKHGVVKAMKRSSSLLDEYQRKEMPTARKGHWIRGGDSIP